MRIDNRDLTWSLMPLFLAGVLCNTLTVYHQEHICAVEGSTVVIPCSFYYPDTHSVKRFVWLHVKSHHVKGRLIYDRTMTKVTPRFQYIGDKKHNCTSKIQQVEHRDAGKYIFRFITNSKEGKWIRIGSTLKVVDLNVSVTQPGGNRTTKEGDSVNLTCLNVCDDGPLSSAFSWRKNGEPIDEGPALYLSNMSSTHSGNYTCSLKTHTGTTSGVIHIDVEYGPKNTSVSVRSMEEVAASNITLTCSSHANPPVNYTWFKIDDDDDDVDIVDVGHRPDFLPADGGQYFCSATNKHGSQNSSVVTLKMKPYPATFTRDVCIIATVAVLLMVTTGIGLRRVHKTRTWTTKTEEEEDTQETDYVNWLACDNNQSQEGNQCEGGAADTVYTTVYFKKQNMGQQMDTHTDDDDDDEEDVIYISVKKPTVEPFFVH